MAAGGTIRLGWPWGRFHLFDNMTPPAEHVSVTLPVGQAIERVKQVLFQPFDAGKWFIIGFCAWLAYLGEHGFQAHYNFGSEHRGGVHGVREWVEHAWDYVAQNLSWILPLAVTVLVFGAAIWVLVLWVSSRGRFMFLHCVAHNKAEVAVPWRKFAREGNSVFWFRLVLTLAGWAAVLPPLIVMAVVGWRMMERDEASLNGIVQLVGAGLLLVLIGVAFWVVAKLLTDFVVPIMFLRGGGCLQGWGVLLGLLFGNPARFILYFLFQIVLSLGIVVLILTAVLATCCVLGCFLAIPYLGTVLLLPVLVFRRAYSVCYLAQYGPDYDAFGGRAPLIPG